MWRALLLGITICLAARDDATGEKPDATTLALLFAAAPDPVSARDRPSNAATEIRLAIEPIRPVGAQTILSFRYRLAGSDHLTVRIFDVTDHDDRVIRLTRLRPGRWASAEVDFTRDAHRADGAGTPFAAGHLVDSLSFVANAPARTVIDLQVQDVRLFDAVTRTLWPYLRPPRQYAGRFGSYRSLLRFDDGRPVATAQDWRLRREQIVHEWQEIIGRWPPLLSRPRLERMASTRRENFTQQRVKVQVTPTESVDAYLLMPDGPGPFPAVLVTYYEPDTSVGLGKRSFRDYAYQLARRGYVTLAIGPPGGDALRVESGVGGLQPLAYLAYVAANAHTALAQLPTVDPARIGIVGHSYGAKWAMFAACLYDKFAAGVWSDASVAFDETRPNANYWDPWYLGAEPGVSRPDGLPGPPDRAHPRLGAYKRLVAGGHDLHELQALMAPRPFLVAGGAEDGPGRWLVLNHVVAVNGVLGFEGRVGMTNRPAHSPTEESNELLYLFFEHYLKGDTRR